MQSQLVFAVLIKKQLQTLIIIGPWDNGPCHVSGIFLPLRVNSLPLATIYEVKIPLRKWKKSLLQRNPAQMTWAINTWDNVPLRSNIPILCATLYTYNLMLAAVPSNREKWLRGKRRGENG
jgi:hypothetical protein